MTPLDGVELLGGFLDTGAFVFDRCALGWEDCPGGRSDVAVAGRSRTVSDGWTEIEHVVREAAGAVEDVVAEVSWLGADEGDTGGLSVPVVEISTGVSDGVPVVGSWVVAWVGVRSALDSAGVETTGARLALGQTCTSLVALAAPPAMSASTTSVPVAPKAAATIIRLPARFIAATLPMHDCDWSVQTSSE